MSSINISKINVALDQFTSSVPHKLTTGDAIKFFTDMTIPGLIDTSLYFVRAIDSNVFALYPTVIDARNDLNRIDITSLGEAATLENLPLDTSDGSTLLVAGDTFFVSSENDLYVWNGSQWTSGSPFVTFKIGSPQKINQRNTTQVFMQGLTTSPTYIFTQDAPKEVAVPPELNEIWILS